MKTIIYDHMKSLGRWLACFSVAVVVYLTVFDYARTLAIGL
jgi:dolichol kinase